MGIVTTREYFVQRHGSTTSLLVCLNVKEDDGLLQKLPTPMILSAQMPEAYQTNIGDAAGK